MSDLTAALKAAAERLADLLAEENAALEAVDYAAVTRGNDGKRVAIEAFQAALAAVRAGDVALAADEALGMTPSIEHLRSVAARNQQLLARAMTVQARVLGCVLRALPATRPAPGRYGATGAPARVSSAPVAIFARA